MTIDEAIGILESKYRFYRAELGENGLQAIKLGIEGLKLIQYQSPDRTLPGTKLLPGETEK